MCDVAVYVHCWRFTVLWNILVVWRTALVVHCVHTGNGYVLVALSDVTATAAQVSRKPQRQTKQIHRTWLERQNTDLQMILSVRIMRLVIPLRSFLLIWSATHTGVSVRAKVRGVSPSLFMMSISAPLDRNNLHRHMTDNPTCYWLFVRGSAAADTCGSYVQWSSSYSRDTFQVALSGSDVERRVTMHVNRGERTAGVQHQLCDIHISRIRCPVETDVHLLKGKVGRKSCFSSAKSSEENALTNTNMSLPYQWSSRQPLGSAEIWSLWRVCALQPRWLESSHRCPEIVQGKESGQCHHQSYKAALRGFADTIA